MVDFTDNDDDIFTGKEHTPIRKMLLINHRKKK
jgi:hypothetical protein